MLETLVIAQASLLAIVISVSMMSMQVSTNRFAPQLSQLYRESSFNAIVARFGISILLDLSLFALPGAWMDQAAVRVGVVGVVIGVASWAFVSLLDIEDRLLVFLNPEPVLESLVESVSFDRYHAFSVNRREEGLVARNPILEIFQLAQTSLEQSDNYSALRAVDALEEATERLLSGYAELPGERRTEATSSVHKLFDYWDRIADRAVERGADDVLHAIVDAELAVGREAIDLDLPTAATGAVDAVFHFCAVTLANNRLESGYHATLGDLLSASLEAGMLEVARRAVTDLARLSQLVDRRDDDLLVADDERITPHEEFFDNWAYFLDVHHPRLGTDQCRSLYVHFERQYRNVREEATADGRVADLDRVAAPGFRAVGIAAATADVQWAVSRTTEHLLELALLTERTSDPYVDDIGRIVDAGGRNGVEDAIHRLRDWIESGDDRPGADSSWLVADPVTDDHSGADGRESTDHARPVRPSNADEELDRLLDTLETTLTETASVE
ncbi:hypothetical protein [Salinirubellus litoreus]|uniref:hypothetical protein n=1 Tax=Salinirubellus litoreus TaxID=3131999 RepID=UPI0030CDE1F0